MSGTTTAELPLISMSRLFGGTAVDVADVARQIRAACEDVGFFYVCDHGVPQALIADTFQTCLRFYRRPQAEKLRSKINHLHRGFLPMRQTVLSENARTDYKESFTMGLDLPANDVDVKAGKPLMGANVFPEDMPEMRAIMVRYRESLSACAHQLLRAIGVSLDLPVGFFDPMYEKPLVRVSANYYPPSPEDSPEDQFGTSPHTDYGVVTLLWQD